MNQAAKRERIRILAGKQKWRCHYCNRRMWHQHLTSTRRKVKKLPGNRATVEHKMPQCRGGSNKWNNTIVACCDCNGLRADIPYVVFKRASDEGLGAQKRVRRVWDRIPMEIKILVNSRMRETVEASSGVDVVGSEVQENSGV